MELSIAKERYNYSDQVKEKLSYENWVRYIDSHLDYFEWLENTSKGKDRLENIDKIPEAFRRGILDQLDKSQALAEFSQKKGWHEIIVDFHRDIGVIKTTFMNRITKAHLKRLLDMANYLNAYLLNNGNEIIDEKFIESQGY